MQNIKPIVISIGIILVLIAGFIVFNKPQTPEKLAQPSPTTIIQNREVSIKASFTVITNNITRSFQAEKYHNQSLDVFIESSDPTIIRVKKTGITWDDFFKTLPMKLTKECLITGDGETLCSGKNGILRFYLNDIQIPDLLDKEIRDGDKILINFSPQ